MGQSKKYRDVANNPKVAFVIDDVIPEPWQARGIEIRGTGEALPTGGQVGTGELIRITPRRIVAWGIETEPYKRNSRNV